ncbi:hypothetical protein F3J23_14750 [Chryseobacterium sp. Tr-659]|uniref:hypothetical protein n=1 Tax=Chryseobacterium sp. Tr-659 TaxID=2608340 RepID=UPI0014203F88|nr:hypothetical protein [Chryseobacterium sp. Tr-659]NIF06705.1 hypothetical protein [Chryseobacterium sp. Tr-659]
MRNIFFLLVIFSISFSCKKEKKNNNHQVAQKSSLKITDTTKINGILVELIDNNGIPELKVHSKTYKVSGKIKISPPFYFLRNPQKTVQDFAYKDIGVDHTLIIMGKIATPEEREKFGETDKNKLCGRHMQGLLFKKQHIIITNHVLRNSFACTDTGTDEKDFWAFAHD